MTTLSDARERLRCNARQWEAFNTTGHCLVTAPPGSGKTELIGARLAQDFIDVIAEPHGAACITYSNTAAAELRRRLDSFGVQRRSNLFIGTVHGFALNQIIRPFAGLFGEKHLATAPIANTAQRDALFEEARQVVYPNEPDFGLRSTMDRRRRHLLVDDADPMFGGERAAELTRCYEDLLATAGLIDFDEMVIRAVTLVKQHRVVRSVLAARFPKLFIDEYQDLGPGLHALVKSLCFDEMANSTLFAVADPDQCIYVFSGAAPELVEEIAERSDVHHVRLRINYRSSEEIIRRSLALLPRRVDVEGRRKGGVVEAHQVEGKVSGQARACIPLLKQALKESKPEGLAVLCLSNADCATVGEILQDAGISVFVRREDEYARTVTTQFVEYAAAWATNPRGTSGVTLRMLLWQWRQLLGVRWTRQHDISLVTVLLDSESASHSAAEFVRTITSLDLEAALAADRTRAEEADSLASVLHAVTDGSLSSLSAADLGERAFARNRVHVLTMHSSKGLEFDLVCLIGLESTRLPRFNAAQWERVQDRRKFYVALTRARHEVHLFYTGWMINRFGNRYEHGPSEFVTRLGL
jgi:DNA helicase-2/ATP-dependent DNA helicase PcrA